MSLHPGSIKIPIGIIILIIIINSYNCPYILAFINPNSSSWRVRYKRVRGRISYNIIRTPPELRNHSEITNLISQQCRSTERCTPAGQKSTTCQRPSLSTRGGTPRGQRILTIGPCRERQNRRTSSRTETRAGVINDVHDMRARG